jgi:hypothetical protein
VTARLATLLAVWLSIGTVAADSRQLVLVASAQNPVKTLTNIETRMLFLGYTVSRDGRSLRPVRNVSSPLLNDVFLQHVVAMSQASFDRRTLVATLQKGRSPPVEIATAPGVLRRLTGDPLAVSYMWLTDVQTHPELKVLRVLWVE